jgi:hypothetical protein
VPAAGETNPRASGRDSAELRSDPGPGRRRNPRRFSGPAPGRTRRPRSGRRRDEPDPRATRVRRTRSPARDEPKDSGDRAPDEPGRADRGRSFLTLNRVSLSACLCLWERAGVSVRRRTLTDPRSVLGRARPPRQKPAPNEPENHPAERTREPSRRTNLRTIPPPAEAIAPPPGKPLAPTNTNPGSLVDARKRRTQARPHFCAHWSTQAPRSSALGDDEWPRPIPYIHPGARPANTRFRRRIGVRPRTPRDGRRFSARRARFSAISTPFSAISTLKSAPLDPISRVRSGFVLRPNRPDWAFLVPGVLRQASPPRRGRLGRAPASSTNSGLSWSRPQPTQLARLRRVSLWPSFARDRT